MARAYAGILGPLAFASVAVRGLLRGDTADATLTAACLGLFAFAAFGWLIGQAAALIVDDSVRARLQAERTSRRGGAAKESQDST